MEEYTNSVIDDGSDLFMDDVDTPAEEVNEDEHAEAPAETETATETEAQAEQTETAETEPAKLKIKYNGEEKEISYEEAIILAQKGMNYDKVVQERDTLRNSEEVRILDFYAEQAGMKRGEYVKMLMEQRETAIVQKELSAVRNEFPDISDDAAQALADARAKVKLETTKKAEQERAQQEQEAKQKPWVEFAKKYPNYKTFDDIPEAVRAAVEEGATPIQAMLEYEVAEVKRQLAEKEQKIETLSKNNKNKEKALPSAKPSAGDKEADPFLEGLFK